MPREAGSSPEPSRGSSRPARMSSTVRDDRASRATQSVADRGQEPGAVVAGFPRIEAVVREHSLHDRRAVLQAEAYEEGVTAVDDQVAFHAATELCHELVSAGFQPWLREQVDRPQLRLALPGATAPARCRPSRPRLRRFGRRARPRAAARAGPSFTE